VDVLSELAGDGPALEFAVGTGRIALPLMGRGVTVKGIELSKAMVADLRKKENGNAIEVVVGDICSARIDGGFSPGLFGV
jgi:16S rRNA A1518/A1519 N6-dimethyltransferase RsmA/KsgA/DIM1 with predicted DNA glycosylase/AP lyase activity